MIHLINHQTVSSGDLATRLVRRASPSWKFSRWPSCSFNSIKGTELLRPLLAPWHLYGYGLRKG